MPSIAKLERLIKLVKSLPAHTPITFDEELNDNCEWTVEPITVSCDDLTIVGYIVTNQDTVN
jgi:hypothetical protein